MLAVDDVTVGNDIDCTAGHQCPCPPVIHLAGSVAMVAITLCQTVHLFMARYYPTVQCSMGYVITKTNVTTTNISPACQELLN